MLLVVLCLAYQATQGLILFKQSKRKVFQQHYNGADNADFDQPTQVQIYIQIDAYHYSPHNGNMAPPII